MEPLCRLAAHVDAAGKVFTQSHMNICRLWYILQLYWTCFSMWLCLSYRKPSPLAAVVYWFQHLDWLVTVCYVLRTIPSLTPTPPPKSNDLFSERRWKHDLLLFGVLTLCNFAMGLCLLCEKVRDLMNLKQSKLSVSSD